MQRPQYPLFNMVDVLNISYQFNKVIFSQIHLPLVLIISNLLLRSKIAKTANLVYEKRHNKVPCNAGFESSSRNR